MYKIKELEILGGKKVFKKNFESKLEFINTIRDGIPKSALETLEKKTGLTDKNLAEALHVSERTFYRIKAKDKLSAGLSERVFQIAEVITLAQDVLGKENVFDWLHLKNTPLASPPLELFDTSIGIQMVKDELHRIQHGVFS